MTKFNIPFFHSRELFILILATVPFGIPAFTISASPPSGNVYGTTTYTLIIQRIPVLSAGELTEIIYYRGYQALIIFFFPKFIIRLKAIFLVTTTNIKKSKRFQSKKKDQNILLVYVISFLISGISFGYNRCLIGRLSLKDLLCFYLRFGQQEKCLLDFEKCLLNFKKCLLDF